ncbi:glyoxalase superfamily protein [Primorskyibacter sp. 2E233]|uniref:glyoxalase superfamily protein n=1 Tax=Primorskyibacter sp. 2E233 TaxID=3413431 RepID=UPI003BF27A83
MTQPTLETVKAQAKALRRALQAEGTAVSHARSLELVARQYGARDWNTLHARLRQDSAATELALGAQVSGHYLGQAYSGRVVALSGPVDHRQVEIALDQPIDTVRFDSFSNWRHRIRGVLGQDGRSRRKTSDGTPHLTVDTS